MKLSIAISPCPNDTFIFDAIFNKRIDLKGYDFEFHFHDVEELNKLAVLETYDITKLSYFAALGQEDKYTLLDSGGALGHNCGPLLISNTEIKEVSSNMTVAIPGKNTTANFLLSQAYPQLTNKTEVLFSEIENEVLSERFDLGLIIHESRFTYEQKGLKKVRDLGQYWEETTHSPIPLGAIALSKKYSDSIKSEIDNLISQSVKYAFAHPEVSRDFIKEYSQELDDDVIQAHIDLYVNEYSIALGEKGQKALNVFRSKYFINGTKF